ncbi:hydrolase, NUDIX family [Dictyocaulus viviparus]|uniref:Hydrolase, NUDIX family n=1 Tax=Dictyocaulus viviparus TaxID=29172 RepID=A0A0D8XSC1_DICVI|nr:hydrolase, NUDIX family [Dictyocaulus viviparus]
MTLLKREQFLFTDMVISDEEDYIAESRDPTPEPTPEFIEISDSPGQGILKNGKLPHVEEKKHLEGEIFSEERAPDMQLGTGINIIYDELSTKYLSSGWHNAAFIECRYVRLHDNVNYVAAGIILRGDAYETTEVLLIQEAKKTCYGKWYMPAGRVEAGETLENAVKREVREESGYECDVVELLSLEVQGSGWYRFSFYCEISGGTLKTQPNQESLGAQWWSIDDVLEKKLQLRVKDFLRLLEQGLAYRNMQHYQVPRILPLNVNVPGLFVEFMIVRHSLDESRTEVLVHKSIKDEQMLTEHDQPFPTVEFGFEYFFAMVVSKVYRHLLEEGGNVVFAPSHVVRIKCHPNPIQSLAHGLSVRLYCQHKKCATKAVIRSPRYHWIPVDNKSIREQLYMEKYQYRPSLKMI